MTAVALKGAHLSLQQERLWLFQQGNTAYRSQCTIMINGKLYFQPFQQALQHMVEQHTIFQTLFYALPGMDVPVQILGRRVHLDCPIISLEQIAAPDQSASLETLLKSLQEEAFDLEHGPLLRIVLFRLSAETTLLLINLPAFYADATTLPLFITGVVKQYTANLLGQELIEEPLQYTDVSAWQRQQIEEESDEAKIAGDFWAKIDLTQAVEMQLTKIGIVEGASPHTTHDFAPATLSLPIEDNLYARIHALASRSNVSVPTVLLTSWLVVLWRLIDESRLVIGLACDGRNYEELEDALGLHTSFVPFSPHLEGNKSFEQVLGFVEPLLQATRKHQSYFSWPSDREGFDATRFDATRVGINPTPTDAGFFPIAFEQECWPASFRAMDVSLHLEQHFCYTEPFILKLGVLQVGEDVTLKLHYDTQRVSSERIHHLAAMLQTFLHSMIEQPQAPISALSLLNNTQRTHLLTTFSAPSRSWSAQGFHHLFEAQVRRTPHLPAVLDLHEQLTYQQLNQQANQLAQVLRQCGVKPNTLVGVCLSRQAHMLVAVLAILKAGAAYLPLDTTSPALRLSYQLHLSQATLLLTQQELHASLPAWEGATICLEDLEAQRRHASSEDLSGELLGEELASVIFTSGSTGNPKGVMVRHRSVVNYTLALCEQLGAEPGWQYATVSTLAADLGNTAIFCALASGGCVQILPYETVTSGEAMARWAEQHPFEVLKIVPSHLSALLEGQQGPRWLPRRALVLGGEALSEHLVARVRQMGAACQIYNHYGPTETTIGVLVNPLGEAEQGERSSQAVVALGRPIANTQVYVLDQHLHVVPQGVIGELYIGGAGVARGYLHQAEQTAERFVPHPFVGIGLAPVQPGERLYRTGDLVRYGWGGQIEFVGRRDGQVKLRGYRIELGEIEAALRAHPQIRDCAVILRDDIPGGPQLVCYVVPKQLPLQDDMNIREFLQERLPDYMLPAVCIYLKFLPLTANGKIDRPQLIASTGEESHNMASQSETNSTPRKIIQPRDPVEMHLLQIWEQLLPLQPISVVDNFFDLGGHSLLAVRLMSHIAERIGRNLDLATLFQHPTIAELAVILRQQSSSEEDEEKSLLAVIQAQGSRPPFFCIHPAGGTAFCYVNLARHLGPDQPFYGLHAPFGSGMSGKGETVGETVEEIAARYITAIQSVQQQGPYLLGGWSLGGVIAFEMAQQLQRQGQEVAILAIIDSAISDPQSREKALAEGIDLEESGIVKDFVSAARVVLPDDFEQRALDKQLSYAVEQAKRSHFIPIDVSVDLVRTFTRVRIKTKHIVHTYAGSIYTSKIDYFLSNDGQKPTHVSTHTESSDERGSAEEPAYMQPWRTLAKGGFEIHHIPGRHIDMIEEPNVQVLAKALKLRIDETCEVHA